jgi:hypothetical protein
MLSGAFTRSATVVAWVTGLLLIFDPIPGRADIGFGALGIDANSLISPDVIKSLVTFIGFGTQHRPYEPATPLGLAVGLDFSIETTLFKVPDSLFSSLGAVGAPSSAPLPSLPVPKIHLHKGFGELLDAGGSFFYLTKYWLLGADVKVTLIQGEEGPTYALRFCYSYADLTFNGINLVSHTFSPQLVASRQMEFADPYVGLALEYATGKVKGEITIPADTIGPIPAGVTIPPVTYTSPNVSAFGAFLFGGVSLRIPRSGLRLTIEGSYNTAGTSSMGTKMGFTF